MDNFYLDDRLKNDTLLISDMDNLMVLLMNNNNLPWVIIVPKINNLSNFVDMPPNIRDDLFIMIDKISNLIHERFTPDRINIAMLGNIVSQMHWHIVARFENDPCWPKPVWGNIEPSLYDNTKAEILINFFKNRL